MFGSDAGLPGEYWIFSQWTLAPQGKHHR